MGKLIIKSHRPSVKWLTEILRFPAYSRGLHCASDEKPRGAAGNRQRV
jgi:hypothetical protein